MLQHIQSLFMDGDKINMQLSYTFAFEWIWHWLLGVCVYVCIYYSSIDYNVRVFLFLSQESVCPNDLLDFVSVCLHCVLVLFREAWICWGFDSKNALWVLRFWTHWNSMMGLVLLVRHWVNRTLRCVVCLRVWICCPFQHNRALCKRLIQMDGFYAKETKYSPKIVHFKDYRAIDACGGFNTVWMNSFTFKV